MASDSVITFAWINGILLLICCLGSVGVTTLLIRTYLTKEHYTLTPTNDGPKRNKIFLLGIFVNIFLIVSSILGVCNQFYFLNDSSADNLTDDNISFASLTFYFLSQSLAIFLFIYQIEYSFQSTYLLSSKLVKTLFLLACVMVFCCGLGMILLAFGAFVSGLIFWGFWIVLLFGILFGLLFIANKKVVIASSDLNETVRQQVTNLIVVFCVLANWLGLSSLVCLILYTVVSTLFTMKGLDDTGLLFLQISNLISCMVIKLLMEAQLTKNDVSYQKWCHKWDARKKEKLGVTKPGVAATSADHSPH